MKYNAGRVRKGRGLGRDRERETKGDPFVFAIWDEEGRDGDVFVEGALRCNDRWSEYGASIVESNG